MYSNVCAVLRCSCLPQFPYICGVVNEALRLYPPGANTLRETGDDAFQLGPYSLPPRSTVVVGTYVMHRDPAVWPHAAAFMPERWLPVSGALPVCCRCLCSCVACTSAQRLCVLTALMQQLMQSSGTHITSVELPLVTCARGTDCVAAAVCVCVNRATSTWAPATLLPTCPLAQVVGSASGSALRCRRCGWAWCSSCSASITRLTGP